MRRLLVASLTLTAVLAFAAEERIPTRRSTKDADLGKKGSSASPDQSLAGDLTRKKDKAQAAPALQYDQFRIGVELQVASKRREQIDSLKKIISLSPDPKEAPDLLFRLGELYWEESKYFFFEANRKDDDYIRAMNRNDKAGMERAKQEKEQLNGKSKEFSRLAVDQYSEIVQKYKDYVRTDEVLYFLGHNLMEAGEERKALVAFKRLIEKFPKSKYLPDAYLAFGEFHFNGSKGKRDALEKALEFYKKAASYPDNQVYAFALYKQGWCYFNMNENQRAMDMFKAVVLYGEYAGAKAVEKDGGKSGKHTLVREARNDFVRAFARVGSPSDARSEFGKVASKPEDRFLMMKQLANLYYEDGKDREAALTFNTLIKEKPLSPEAPGFQGKIVDCVLRAGNKKMTVEQVRRLVKIMQDVEQAGVLKDDKDKKALEEAKELSERTISNLAVNWHNEAKKTRDDETFGFANEVYSDYLTLFPDGPKAYDLRFFWAELLNDNLRRFDRAAEEYTKVVLVDVKKIDNKQKPGKWLVNAAYNAVLAYDEVVKTAEASGKLKADSSGNDANKKLNIPGEKRSLLEACERYLKYVPNGEKKVEIAFKAANIYYRHSHFEEAIKRFSEIALNYPEYKFENGERAGEMAANLVLDSYNLLQDWTKLNEAARKFYANDKLASGAFRAQLSEIIEQSSFKLVNQLEAKKEYAKAAEAYLTFVSEFPKSQIADKALFNAAIDFYHAKMLDKAIETRKRVIANYPKSQYVPACMYANAEALEAIGDFEDSAQAYEAYVYGYERSLGGGKSSKFKAKAKARKTEEKAADVGQSWDEGKAQIALYNAGVFREGLGQYKQALNAREKYLDLWPDTKDAEAVFLSIADLHERNGAHHKAMRHLEEYEKKYGKDNAKLFVAEGKIAAIWENRVRRPREALKVHERLFAQFEKLGPKGRSKLDNAAFDAVARAHLAKSEEEFKKYTAMKLRWGRLPSPEAEFKQTLRDKARALESVQKLYTQTVQYKAGDPAICALYKIGLAYDNMVDSLLNAPMPRGAPPELQDAIKDELANQAQPVKDKAAEAFAAAVQKGNELDLFNDCSAKALKLLRETYKPEQFPPMYEAVAELKLPTTYAIGQDLLTQIQAVPAQGSVVAGEKAKDEFSDLAKIPKTAPSEKRAPAPANKSGTKKDQKGSDEPEDML